MAKINLLPWREQLREEKQKEFFSFLIIGLGTTIALFIFISLLIGYKIKQQEIRNQKLSQEIHILNNKLLIISELKKEKEELVSRINIIKELQANRPQTVHLFEAIVRIIPRGIYLTEVSRKDNTLTLMGIAESHSQVSNLMLNADRSRWLTDSKLNQIEEVDTPEKNEEPQSKGQAFKIEIGVKTAQTTLVGAQ